MELPASSYNDSLEELWDEEEELEEIETVMRVVPSAYSHYLDVFSKEKEEKLPPHHACDHHIKFQLNQLKDYSTTDPVLTHFNPSLPIILETSASYYSLGAIQSQ
ncbi:hypothetical protein O181_124041, partial [Austropuccinia psidii MF-1]|nr:hypothetical protein [Austropuccinia psidii MF-1]